MPKPETRPVSDRNPEVSPAGDVMRRLQFLIAAVGGPVGIFLLAHGLNREATNEIVAGAILVLVAGLVFLIRRKGLAATRNEIASNPFKPRREPRE